MKVPFIKFHDVSFSYASFSVELFEHVSFHLTPGWSGIVGANGAGKTTLLQLATGCLEPDGGHVAAPKHVIYCAQRTDHAPQKLNAFLSETSKTVHTIKGRLGLCDDWHERWRTLSHGERKRAQIAVALWQQPDALAIDEPTNHIDAEAREIIASALHSFEGVGLLVSHDRELLDALCRQCLFVEPPGVFLRPGGISKGLHLVRSEQDARRKQQLLQKREYKRLKREAAKRREQAQQADKKRSKRGIARKDHDAKQKIDHGRVTGKDAVAGKLLRQLDGRLQQSRQQADSLSVTKEYSLGIWLPGSRSARDVLLQLPAGSLTLGKQKFLRYPELLALPDDRIALTGPNGAGKSALIHRIVTSLNVPKEHLTYVPQEIDVGRSQEILAQVQALSHEKLGHLMTIVSRLGSRPQRLLESRVPSPGELRKLLLALGMTSLPYMIILDEPTNHMDLPSIECLEQALAECPCCLLLVSHDRRFLEKLTQKRWHIGKSGDSNEAFTLQIAA